MKIWATCLDRLIEHEQRLAMLRATISKLTSRINKSHGIYQKNLQDPNFIKFSYNNRVSKRFFNHQYNDRSYISNLIRKYPESPLFGLIGVNVAVWAMWQCANTKKKRNFMLNHFTTSAEALRNWRFHTLLSSTVSHIGGMHLASNMLGLYFFGRQILSIIGMERFFLLYAISGILSSACQVVPNLNDRYNRHPVSLGGSGAVNSLVAMSICAFPKSLIYVYMVIPIPAAIFGILFIGKDIMGLGNSNSMIGHRSHLCGAFCGAAYWFYIKRLIRYF